MTAGQGSREVAIAVDQGLVEVPDGQDYGDLEVVAEDSGHHGGPVDPPAEPRTVYATAMNVRTDDRLPIVPAWARNKDEAKAVARGLAGAAVYATGYHLSRTPKYAGRLAFRAPVGAYRVVTKASGWVFDWEARPVRSDAIRRADADDHQKLVKLRNDRVRLRLIVAAACMVLGAVPVVLILTSAPTWANWLVLAVLVAILGWVGSPVDKPITDRLHHGAKFIRLTAELTRDALVNCGAGIKDPASVKFVGREIHRDGPGHTALVDLPPGVIATDVIDKRDRLAAAFRLPKTQVWPSTVDGEHPGRLQIWVADKPVSSMRPPEWPLLRAGAVDYFKPFTYGFDERMRPIEYRFDEKNGLFAGIPGSGKSLAVRVIALAAVLDPLVIPVVAELKGSGDFDAIEEFCPDGMYVSGATEEAKARALGILEWLLAECDKRGPLPKQWASKGLSTENKVNRVMAERDERLRPIVAIFDEVQELFTDKELGKKAIGYATSIVKRGRSLGIHLILATQRIDKESVPRGISSNIGIRVCLAVTSHVETDLVLGTGAYSRGARPTEFEPGPDSGWGYRAGLGRTGAVRAAYLDNAKAAAIAARARTARSGAPVVEPLKAEAGNVLHDVRSIFRPGETALWSEVIIERLAALRPRVYGDLDVAGLGALMRAAQCSTVPFSKRVDGKTISRYGVKLPELDAAITPELEA